MSFNIYTALAVGFGGFFGAICRFWASVQIAKIFPHQIPLATLSVNLAGSLLIGILVAIFTIFTPSDVIKAMLVTGFLGALTTYSTFAMESYTLLTNNIFYGVVNILLNLIGTIVFAGIGYRVVTKILL
jgi:CrcB protein